MKKIYLSIISILSFTTLFSQTVVNNSFETWTNTTKAEGWYSTNDASSNIIINVFKETTIKSSGTASIKLAATSFMGTNIPAAITNGSMMSLGTPPTFSYDKIVKTPYNDTPDTLTGYIKYTKGGNDTGIVMARFFKDRNLIGEGVRKDLTSTAGAGLERFSIPIIWSTTGVTPDSMYIFAGTSTFTNNTPSSTSVMILDDLGLYSLSGIKSVVKTENGLTVSPNPARDKALIEFTAASSSSCKIMVTDMLGNTVLSVNKSLERGLNKIPLTLTNYKGGIYFVSIESENERAVKKIVVQ